MAIMHTLQKLLYGRIRQRGCDFYRILFHSFSSVGKEIASPPKNTYIYNTAISKINIAEIIELIPTKNQNGVIPLLLTYVLGFIV